MMLFTVKGQVVLKEEQTFCGVILCNNPKAMLEQDVTDQYLKLCQISAEQDVQQEVSAGLKEINILP